MRRRDFTVNAMARRLEDGDDRRPARRASGPRAARPADGVADELRARIRSASCAASASSRSSASSSTRQTRRADARGGAGGPARLGRADRRRPRRGRHGRAVEAPARRAPGEALAFARDTGVLVELIPEFGPARYLADHIFAVVQESADAGDDLAVRLAALFHDLGKPVDGDPLGHAHVGARDRARDIAPAALPDAALRRVVAIVREHPYRAEDRPQDAAEARRFLARAWRRARVRPRGASGLPTCAAKDSRRERRSRTRGAPRAGAARARTG